MLEVRHNRILPADYMKLRSRCGIEPCKEISAVGAIKQSIYTVGFYHDDQIIAFGRVCGDGCLSALVCDLMIDPKYAGSKLVPALVKDIEDYLRETVNNDTEVLVKVDAPMDRLFARFGYKYFDADYELVMKR